MPIATSKSARIKDLKQENDKAVTAVGVRDHLRHGSRPINRLILYLLDKWLGVAE